ncbi:hypothetical protein MN116_006174 [Schistosoma mekongi]|uniref:G-protein coupled receptors family 1 profile domain-containing protein n=1 Tax=Schistosoma mekongi TaxID=38744 RepID=A0AAE1ZBU2_SCHME|nr:hypothetical protein MN116_006174 [Schistosoma mekongi]
MELDNETNFLNTNDMSTEDLLKLLSNCAELVKIPHNNSYLIHDIGNMPGLFKPNWIVLYNVAFDVFLVGCILLAGITGNVLSGFVLARDRSHGTTSLILTSLAVFDTAFLILCLFFQFLKTLSFYILWLSYINFYAHTSKILYGSGMAVRMMRNWTVVLVSLERWVAVCKPLHAPSICTRKKAHVAITLIIVLSSLYNIPHFFIVDAVPLLCYSNEDNEANNLNSGYYNFTDIPKGILIYHSAIRPWVNNNYAFRLIYRLISYTILIVILPNVIIAIFNVLLIRGIKYANQRRAQIIARIDCANRQFEQCNYHTLHRDYRPNSQKQHQTHHHSITNYCHPAPSSSDNHAYFVRVTKSNRSRTMEVNRLCVGVIIIYLVCELPAVGYQIIYLINHRSLIEIIRPVTNALVCLNSGVNFFVYVFLGRRFRSQLKDLLRNLISKCGIHNSQRKVNSHSTRYMNSWHSRHDIASIDKESEQLLMKENKCPGQLLQSDLKPVANRLSLSAAYTQTSIMET